MKKVLLLLSLVAFAFQVNAQRPEEVLNTWSAKSPIEKTYLQFDRENYLAGENAWFKAYLYSDFQPDTITTSLYVELLNESSAVLVRKILPVFFGTANGQLELPDTLMTGSYLVRAYSPTMLNSNPDFIYKRSIFVYGKKNNTALTKPKEKSVRIEFFPEGGNLVTGFNNTVAYKATDDNGLPVIIKGRLKSETGKEIATLNDYHDGMGMFELNPDANEKYFVTIDSDSTVRKYYLPEKTDKGIALIIFPHPEGSFFEIHQRINDPAFQVAYMVGQMQHHTVFRQEFKASKEAMQGVIKTKNLTSGILQVTFFNKDGLPLAERLCFVDNKEYIQPAELFTDTLNFATKGKNHFSVLLKDTVRGSFSVSVTDPEYDLLPSRPDNIVSTLLMTSDLKGYVHNPAYYFSAENDSVQTARDLVMMTNGWRRFKWSDLSGKGQPQANYKDLSYITLAGKVVIRDTKKVIPDKQLLLMITGADSTRSMQMIKTDAQGNFRLDSMLFFGPVRLLFSDIRGKKNEYVEIKLNGDSVTRYYPLTPVDKLPSIISDGVVANNQSKLGYDYDAILKANGTMLEAVVLKVRKRTLLEEMEEKYTSGAFSGGGANRTIDLVNSHEADTYITIFDYLRVMVPGLDFTVDGGDYIVYYRQGATASAMGAIPMTMYLNEIETDASVIASIPSNQVAMVKVFSNFVGAVGNGPGGVLAIYTKKGADITSSSSTAYMMNYKGYSVVKEFYAPDYSVNKTTDRPDNRITLDWRPNILVNHIDPKVPFTFYNNERTKRFKVVVEGMTTTGKMILIEKIISPSEKRSF